MQLCDVCQTLDFRALFLLYLEKGGSDSAVSFPHSIFGIRRGSQEGCELCSFTWSAFMTARIEERKLWSYMGPQGDITDEELSSRYKALFWAASSGGWVRIWSPDREGDMVSNNVAAFVALPIADEHGLVLLLSEEIVADSGSDRALTTALKWLEECHNKHEHCFWTKLLSKNLPTRVIDAGSGEDCPRLHITADGDRGLWTALSYCWGGASEFVLTEESQSRFERGIPLEDFPATLRDGITATRAMGIRYIWIDALCIFQDSTEDWEREAPLMGSIYTNAEVVIAATGSENVNAGIFKSRPRPATLDVPWRPIYPRSESDEQFVRIHSMNADSLSTTDFKEPRWSTRGWTMQEDFMATRLLMFTDKQTHWECLTTKIDESGFRSTPGYVFAESRDYCSRYVTRMISARLTGNPFSCTDPANENYDPNFYKMWYVILKKYSQRNLAKTSDRLPALSGLANCFQVVTQDHYCAGLWKNDIISGLTWSHGHWGHAVEEVSREVGGPSWSWTSLEGKLDDFVFREPPTKQDEVPQNATRIVDIQVDLASWSQFGAVRSGKLVIEAPFVYWKPIGEDPTEDTSVSNLQNFIASRISNSRYAVAAEFKLRHKPYVGQSFVALHLFTGQDRKAHILLLESVERSAAQVQEIDPTGEKDSEHEEQQPLYVRVGKLAIRTRWIFDNHDDPAELSYVSEMEHGAYGECETYTLPSQYPSFLVPQEKTSDPLPVQRFVVI